MEKLECLYFTHSNNNTYEIKIDDNFNYYLFINDKYIKKYKYKNALYNFVRLTYNVNLIF